MKGKLIGVGVGPGDPKLLTFKAVEAIRGADFVAYPTSGEQADGSKASNLALHIVNEHLDGKELLEYLMPMSRDKDYVRRMHDICAEDIRRHLDAGKTVAFVTLGDPSIYSTYMYIHKKIKALGYETELIPGIPSFCAVAASLDDSLCEGDEPLVIIPASYDTLDAAMAFEGNQVYMKSGKTFARLREKIRERGLLDKARMVEKASMEDEKIHLDLDAVEEKSSYFSIVVVKPGTGEGVY